MRRKSKTQDGYFRTMAESIGGALLIMVVNHLIKRAIRRGTK